MAVSDMIPTLADADLASLKSNAARLEATGTGAQQKAAAALLPLIDAEMADRLAKKPAATPTRVRKPKAAERAVEEPA